MTTNKIIIISVGSVILIALMIGIRVYIQSRATPSVASNSQAVTPIEVASTTPSTLEDRVRELEFSLADIITQLKSVAPNLKTSSTSKDLDNRVKTLEVSITDLQNRVKILESGKTTSTTTSSSKSSIQIPLNWSGSTTGVDWGGVGSGEIVINSADYPGATNFQFQVNIKTNTSGGRAYARIFNKDDNSSIGSSELSSDSTGYIFVTSGTFSMPNSRKTYYLQMKSSTDHEATVQSAWVKVNY